MFGKDFAYFDFVHAKTKEKAHVEELMLSSRDGKENAVKNNEEESEKDGGNKNKREEEENAASKMNKKANNNNNRKMAALFLFFFWGRAPNQFFMTDVA